MYYHHLPLLHLYFGWDEICVIWIRKTAPYTLLELCKCYFQRKSFFLALETDLVTTKIFFRVKIITKYQFVSWFGILKKPIFFYLLKSLYITHKKVIHTMHLLVEVCSWLCSKHRKYLCFLTKMFLITSQ